MSYDLDISPIEGRIFFKATLCGCLFCCAPTLRFRVRSILLPLFVLLLAEWYNIAAALTHDSSLFLDVYDWNHEQGELS